MRQCAVKVPHNKRKWRLVSQLREDGLLAESDSEESVETEESGEPESEEDLSFLETDSESEVSEEETEDTESEEGIDWYGLVET